MSKAEPVAILDNGQKVWAYNAEGKPICNRKLNNVEARCQQSVGLKLNGRCRKHGSQLKGEEHPSLTHGRTSKYAGAFTGKMAELYAENMRDENYASLKADIAVTSGRIRILLEEFRDIDNQYFTALIKASDSAQELLEGEYDDSDLEESLRELLRLIESLRRVSEKGREVERTQEHLRRLVDTDTKQLQIKRETITAEKAFALLGMFAESVLMQITVFLLWLRDNHPDIMKDPKRPDIKRGVQSELVRIMPRALPEVIETSKEKTE